MIDSFQYATPAEAQSIWSPGQAGQPALPVSQEGFTCLSLPCGSSTNLSLGYWDRTDSFDLSGYPCIAIRLKCSLASVWFTLFVQTGGGGAYTNSFRVSDAWQTYVLSQSSFGTNGAVSGWNDVSGFRLTWEPEQQIAATGYVADLRASSVTNLLVNGGFEVATTEAMPDYWGPVYNWGCRTESWVTNMAGWREQWGVDRAISHSGTRSLRIVGSTDPTERKAVHNWMAVASGHTNTLSAWLKSDQADMPVKLEVAYSVSKTVYASTNWQRYALVAPPGSNPSQSTFLIYPTAAGTLWVDDVQVEDGAWTNAWRPSVLDANLATQTVHKAVAVVSDYPILPSETNATVHIDCDARRFLIDGQAFIPIAMGWDGLASDIVLQDIAHAGFNTITPIIQDSVTTTDLRSFLDRANTCGLKVVPWVDQDVSLTTLSNWVTNLKAHPAIIVWYVYDEPHSTSGWQDANAKYSLAKALDPDRPIMVNGYPTLSALSSNWWSDILCTDLYPVPGSSLHQIATFVDTIESTAAPVGKPTWFWLQSMGYAFSKPREPTGAETECMAYLALIHGSRGLTYFQNKPRTVEIWNELRQLTREIRTLMPVLYSTSASPNISVSSPSIHGLGKKYDNRKYLIAVNDSPSPIEATLSMLAVNPATATVLFENRTVDVASGTITDLFAGYERHVYAVETFLVDGATPASPLSVRATTAKTFSVAANDPLGGSLTYAWQVDAITQSSTGTNFTFSPGGADEGTHVIQAIVQNQNGGAETNVWNVTVTPELDRYRMKIALPGYADRSEVLTNFPLLVCFSNNVAGSMFDYLQFASIKGYDLRFRDAADTTNLNYEIEKWDPSGVSYAWVQLPTIFPDGSTFIWATWGDVSDTDQLACTTNGATWDGTFAAVWHMDEVSGLTAHDSTANANHGTLVHSPAWAAGRIGGALAFNASNKTYVNAGTSPSLCFTSNCTLSAWIYPTLYPVTNYYGVKGGIIARGPTSTYNYELQVGNSTNITFCKRTGTENLRFSTFTVPTLTAQWTLVTMTVSGRTASLYVNGSLSGVMTLSGRIAPGTADVLYLGSAAPALSETSFAGSLDEIRICNVARSPEWLWACWMNQVSNSAFARLGAVSGVAPCLSVRQGHDQVIVSWPAGADNWLLESTNTLSDAGRPWSRVTPPFETNGALISVTISNVPATGSEFFRLRR